MNVPVGPPADVVKRIASDRSVQGRVLLIDDDQQFSRLVERHVRLAGFHILTATSAADGTAVAQSSELDAIVLDLGLPDAEGLSILRSLLARRERCPIIILTADNSVGSAVTAMHEGAYDYLAKPVDAQKLITTLRHAVERNRLERQVASLQRNKNASYRGMIGTSAVMRALFAQIEKVGVSDVTTAIHGESGAGKELVARALHDVSARHDGPFVAFNCAVIPETLQESELFGHEEGAFAGALARRVGRLEQANGGTLFLDEVAELPLSLQAKLLRCLQERCITRVGGSSEVETDFRLLTATHKDLSAEVAAGRFRADLYYRLAVLEVELPPLRDRIDDIPLLAQHFLQDLRDMDGRVLRLAPDALEALYAHGWKGNVRELQNVVQHAAVVARDGVIRRADLPARVSGMSADAGLPRRSTPPAMRSAAAPAPIVVDVQALEPGSSSQALAMAPPRAPNATSVGGPPLPRMTLQELEKLAIRQAIARNRGNLSAAIRELGIGRTTLYRKLQEYGITASAARCEVLAES